MKKTDDSIVLREPAGGKEITIAMDDVDEIVPSLKSAMPPRLANQLISREQFLDIARFLVDINEGRLNRLRD